MSLDEEMRLAERSGDARRLHTARMRAGLEELHCIFCGHWAQSGTWAHDARCQVPRDPRWPQECGCDHSSLTDEMLAPINLLETMRMSYEARHGIDKRVAQSLHPGATLYHVRLRNRDGTPLRGRINGMLKTWKRDLLRFRLPMKHGMYDFFYIERHNANEWRTKEEWANGS